MIHTHSPAELTAIENATGLHLAGYVLAGEPATAVPIFVRAERAQADRRRIVLRMNDRAPIFESPSQDAR